MSSLTRTGTIGDGVGVKGGINYALQQIYEMSQPQPVDETVAADAAKRLGELPLNEIPDPSKLATGSRIPFVPNPHFIGRREELHWLSQTLKKGRIAVVSGLDGIGKTQVAVEFVHRYGQFFAGGVYWVNCSNPGAIPSEIGACRPFDQEIFSLEDRIRRVSSEWQSPLPRLLVFDNCEYENLLKEWRPKTGGSRLLVTTRKGYWDETLGIATRPLGVLSRPESIALLTKHRPDLNDDDAAAVADELEDLPLALNLAASFLKRYEVSPGDYLRRLRAEALLDHPSLQKRAVKTSPTDHFSHAGRAFAVSYGSLDPDNSIDQTAISLFSRAACFAPGIPIPRELLLKTLRRSDQDITFRAIDACDRLVELGLLEKEADGSMVLHGLLPIYISTAAKGAEALEAVERTLYEEAGFINESGVPTELMTWQTHLRWLTDSASDRWDEPAASLSSQLGSHLHVIGDFEGARTYHERALAIREKILGPEHPKTVAGLENLAALLSTMRDYEGSRTYLERALTIRERVLGPEHQHTAPTLNNLGMLLKSMGDYESALPYLERAVAIAEQVLGPDHPNTAVSQDNLGMLLEATGNYEGSRTYLERALAIREKILGREHPNTALSLNTLGSVLELMGDYEGARPYHERALAIREKVLGPEHPHTAVSLNNFGSVLSSLGDYQRALPYLERALAISEQVLGPEHLNTAANLNNLGSVLESMGDYQGAGLYCERALAIREKVLGPDHPDTATSLSNRGILMEATGDYQGARTRYERALAIREKVLGPDHPDTLLVRENLETLDASSTGPNGRRVQ